MSATNDNTQNSIDGERQLNAARHPVWKDHVFWMLIVGVAVIYLVRLPAFPIHGEESRWANSATEMLESGDWIVPRQQDQVFPERPPMNVWLMAAGGWIRGSVDVWAIRLPSVIAIVLTCGLLYGYARQFLSPAGALAAGGIYATLGQVLQIGRLGESEAILALFVTAALLSFHLGVEFGWRRFPTFAIAYAFAALAALTKGLQGPIYLGFVSCCYLAYQRQWRWLICWQHVAGMVTGLSLILFWQIPFALATDLQSVRDIWTGLVIDRVTLSGLFEHVATYPIETIGCLMPWSLMLIQLLQKDFRRSLARYGNWLTFCAMAVVLAYPSVWLVAGARGRYFMPLYGCIAIIFAVVVHASFIGERGSWASRGWIRFARIVVTSCWLLSVALSFLAVWAIDIKELTFHLPSTLAFALIASVGMFVVWSSIWRRTESTPSTSSNKAGTNQVILSWNSAAAQVGVTLLCLGFAYVTIAPQIATKHGHHVRENAQIARMLLPADQDWVSFGPLHHRFIYHLGEPVTELQWPDSNAHVSESVEYFLLDYHVWDTPETRLSGRGRKWSTTPGTLPFEWDEVMRIPMDRSYLDSDSWVIVGKIRRSEEVAGRPASLRRY